MYGEACRRVCTVCSRMPRAMRCTVSIVCVRGAGMCAVSAHATECPQVSHTYAMCVRDMFDGRK